jgi:hypothetical protein
MRRNRQSHLIGSGILDNYDFLNRLAKTKSEKKKSALLEKASCDELLAITEICVNILKSKFCLTPSQKRRLVPFANFVRKLSRVRSERSARRVVQSGGGPALAAILFPILREAAQLLISKISDGQ